MKTGKVFLIIFVVFATVIGLATIQDYSPEDSTPVEIGEAGTIEAGTVETVEDTKTGATKVTVSISDGVGSGDMR